MGFFNKIAGLYKRVIQSVQDARDVIFNLPEKIEENSQLFKTIFNSNWSDRNINDMEEVVEEVKHRVIHELIPAAGSLNSLGAPGVIVYIPCQIAGALAIAHIYNPEYIVNRKYMLNVARVMIYGELAGELVWLQLVEILTPLLTPPVVGVVMTPYMQILTEIELNKVHK